MKTIMQILPSLKQGGVETGTIEIATALCQANIPNIVVSSGGEMVALLDKLGVKHIVLPVQSKNPFVILKNALKISKIVQEYGVGLMHVRSRAPAWSVWLASKKTGVPFISSYHGIYGIKPKIKKLYNSVMLKGKHTIAVSEYVKLHLMKEYNYPQEKVTVIHRGADLNRFNHEKVTLEKIDAFAQEYQIPMDKPIITLVGRLSKVKGQIELIQALKKMRHKEVTCLLVGGGATSDYQQELNVLIKALPEETNVKIISVSGKQMPFVYALSNVVVSARITPEAFGRTISEANAMKRIVVAFNHGGPTETIIDGQTGFLIPVGDILELAKCLDKVLEMSSQEKEKMEERAYQNVCSYFSVQTMCDKTLSLYKELLNE